MTWFNCFIEGENFPGSLLGTSGLFGFFTQRTVEAETAEEAEMAALGSLRLEPMLAAGSRANAPDAKVYFTEIVEVDGPSAPNTGMTWFAMDTPDEQDTPS
ncbi:MAG: hypothetical protein ACK4M2_02730 [Brevundimonas sp.]